MATFQTKDMTDEPNVNHDDRIWGSFGEGCGIPTCNCSPGYWISISVGGVLTRIMLSESEVARIRRHGLFDIELTRDEEDAEEERRLTGIALEAVERNVRNEEELNA